MLKLLLERIQSVRSKMNTYTLSDIEDVVHCVFRKVISCYSSDDTLVLEKVNQNIRIVYSSERTSVLPSDPTGMELNFFLDTEEMWISSLHVSVPFRSTGLGRQLVHAAEVFARTIGIKIINVLPIYSSQSFWLKMGYKPHRCTARVLHKSVNSHCHEQTLVLADRL